MTPTMTKQTTAVGVSDDHSQAQSAVNELRRMGFREDQIGVAARHDEAVTGATNVNDKGTNTAIGAAAGAATGASVGALWGMGIVAGLSPHRPGHAGGALAPSWPPPLGAAAGSSGAVGLAPKKRPRSTDGIHATHHRDGQRDGRYLERLPPWSAMPATQSRR